MDAYLYFGLLALFYFVVETVIVALVTKQFKLRGASFARSAVIVVIAWALDVFISLPLLFVFPLESAEFHVAGIGTALLATAIVLRNFFKARWQKAFIVSAAITLIFELVMAVFWQLDGIR